MTTKEHLEKKTSFRVAKVFFILSAIFVVGVTLAIWGALINKIYEVKSAYAVCNQLPSEHIALTDEEKAELRLDINTSLTRINNECYKNKAPIEDSNLTTTQAIQRNLDIYRATHGANLYSIQEFQEGKDYHLGYFALTLIIEVGIFFVLRRTGLYIFGGKEAI